MANIVQLKDNNNAVFYPQTHEKAVIDSNGINLQSKLQNITAPSYVVAWDGTSTPVVANIPSAVTFTFGGNTYTGTLAASSSTTNKTYLVGDNNGHFDQYVTQVSGNTYSWVYLGNTSINLSGYVTDAELSLLEQEINNIQPIVINGDVTNAPDEEDITTDENDLLKFKGRSATLNQLGYKILRTNATFASQVTATNTIYEIRYAFELTDDFQIPSGCALNFQGGSIGGAYTLDLNDCQITGTNGWIGQTLTIAGKTSSPCYADWFVGSDADKVEKAISMFSVVHLNARDYIITRPIEINSPFALFGESLPENFGTKSSTKLIAGGDIGVILNITKGSTFISAEIDNVSFTAQNAYAGLVDGINVNTPNGPSRPFVIHGCNFKRLNRGIYCYYTDTTKSTNLYTLSVIGCNISINRWGIYAVGQHGLGGVNIQDCVMEQNSQGGFYAWDDDYIVGMGQITIQNNLLEGQVSPITIKTSGAVNIEGNYFEATSDHAVKVLGTTSTSLLPVRIFGNNHSNNGARLFTYELSNCLVTDLKDTGSVNFNIKMIRCIVLEKQLDRRMYWVSCDRVFISVSENESMIVDEPVLILPIIPNTLYDGVACLRTPANASLGDAYRNITRTIEVGEYRIVAYARCQSASAAFWLIDSANTVTFTRELPNLQTDRLFKFVHDINVETRITGTNKVQFGWRPGAEGAVSGSGYQFFTNDKRYIPRTDIRAFGASDYNFADIINPKKGAHLYYPQIKHTICYNGSAWVDTDGYTPALKRGATSERPTTLTSTDVGFQYYDSDLSKYIVWNGTDWTNVDGTALN